MNRSVSETWSTWRSLAFLAAIFAVVLGSLMPFAAMAASVPGQPIVICSVEGPKFIHSDGATEADPDGDHANGADCAACVMPLAGALPPPPLSAPAPAIVIASVQTFIPPQASPPPPARAPPRPPSTAPPHA